MCPNRFQPIDVQDHNRPIAVQIYQTIIDEWVLEKRLVRPLKPVKKLGGHWIQYFKPFWSNAKIPALMYDPLVRARWFLEVKRSLGFIAEFARRSIDNAIGGLI